VVRVLGLGHLVALGINSVIGAGIFIVPGPLAKLGILSVFVFILSGLLLHPIALCFAELGKLTDRSGGSYIYAQTAFGPTAGFLVGWATWLTSVLSASTIGSAIAIYLGYFNPSLANYSMEVAMVFIGFFGLVNYFGVRYGGRATELLTVLKTVPLVLIGVAGLFFVRTETFLAVPPQLSNEWLAMPLLMTIFTCCGFEVVPIIAGETKKPMEIVPKAILISLWVPIALYAVLQLGILAGGSTSDNALTDQARLLWGETGAALINATGLISVIGFLAGTILGAPRLLQVLAEDGHLHPALLSVHPRFQTPHVAILLTAVASIAFTLIGDIGNLIALTALSFLLQYLASTLSLWTLVQRQQARGRNIAIIGTLVTLFFLSQVGLDSWAIFIAVSIAGLGLRRLTMNRADTKVSL
jgi:basic amino acid/polyamine antiporter, APA family